MKRTEYWKVIERIPAMFIACGLVGLGYIGSLINLGSSLSNIGLGILISGIVLGLGYKWELKNEIDLS